MTTSRRLADTKIHKFEKNVTKRGITHVASSKKGYKYPVGRVLLGFFVFVVVGSCVLRDSSVSDHPDSNQWRDGSIT